MDGDGLVVPWIRHVITSFRYVRALAPRNHRLDRTAALASSLPARGGIKRQVRAGGSRL